MTIEEPPPESQHGRRGWSSPEMGLPALEWWHRNDVLGKVTGFHVSDPVVLFRKTRDQRMKGASRRPSTYRRDIPSLGGEDSLAERL